MVKGFCSVMVISELLEVLNSLLNPEPKRATIPGTGINETEDTSEAVSDEMSFEETKEGKSNSLKRFRPGFATTSGMAEKMSKDGVYKKVNDILFMIYQTLKEQLFNMPLQISRQDRKTMSGPGSFESPHAIYDLKEDQSLQAGKVFWDYIDPVLKKKLEAQLAFYRQKTQSPVEAKVDVAFMCNSNRGERAGMVLTNDHFNRTD
jgi:hypothetical protein